MLPARSLPCREISGFALSSASITCSIVRCFGRMAAAIPLTVSPLRTVWVLPLRTGFACCTFVLPAVFAVSFLLVLWMVIVF